MSAFHPLGGSASDQHPLTQQTNVPFHGDQDNDEEDSWVPPTIPGEQRIPGRNSSRQSGSKTTGISPLEAPLDPLLNTLPSTSSPLSSNSARQRHTARRHHNHDGGGTFGTGAWSRRGDSSGSSHDANDAKSSGRARKDAAGLAGPAGSSGAVLPIGGSPAGCGARYGGGEKHADDSHATLTSVHTLQPHNYYAPTFCDACSQLLIGIMQQGVQCEVCRMNLHPECASTPCSKEHRCRPPEAVHISAGVDASQVPGVRLKPGYPSAAAGGASGVLRGRFGAAAAGGGVGVGAGNGGRAATAMATVEDPLNSEWHKLLMNDRQLWVPDSVAAGCMVCSRPFNFVIRRHHCRRCGACMCSWCSHMTVSDKILAVQQNTGAVTRISTVEPVRCCTPCTRVLDQQLTQALQRRVLGARQGTPAAQKAPRSVASLSSPQSRPSSLGSNENNTGVAGGEGVGGYANRGGSARYREQSGFAEGYGNGRIAGAKYNEDPLAAGSTVTHYATTSDSNFGLGNLSVGDNVGERSNHYDGIGGGLFHSGSSTNDTLAGQEYVPRYHQQQEKEGASTGVPSWLGKSSLGSAPSRRTLLAGSSFVRRDGEDDEDDEGVGVFDHQGGEEGGEETTDWSISGAVV